MGAAAETAIPEGAVEIDGAGDYLMPGLAEMHGHLPNPRSPAAVTENVVFLYVANGVTTVRGMQGDPSQFALREWIESGELVGPRLYLGSPAMTGRSVTSVEDARRLVREYKDAGYDLLKVHEGLSPAVYDAIGATAKEVGIPFGGHVSDAVGLRHALEAGQATIDHLDNFIEALVPEGLGADAPGLEGVGELLDRIDENQIPELVEALLQAGAYVVPTMVLWQSGIFATEPSAQLIEERPEVEYMPRQTVQAWARAVDQRLEHADLEVNRRVAELRRKILMAIHAGGGGILLGTDSPQIFSVPGFSIHREMKYWVEAGMSPYEVLEAGTRSVAEYLGATDEFGTVAAGKRADLILVQGNPLEDVTNVSRRVGVMVNGRWLPEAEIQQRLAAIAASYAAEHEPG
ncbi:MAG: amidohydrolase family protein [Acidobacteriota bacterium]